MKLAIIANTSENGAGYRITILVVALKLSLSSNPRRGVVQAVCQRVGIVESIMFIEFNEQVRNFVVNGAVSFFGRV
jgi:hypothetical protein